METKAICIQKRYVCANILQNRVFKLKLLQKLNKKAIFFEICLVKNALKTYNQGVTYKSIFYKKEGLK